MSTFFHVLLFSLPFVWIGCLSRTIFTKPTSTLSIGFVIALVGGLLGGIFGKALGLGDYGGFFPPLIGVSALSLYHNIRKVRLQQLAANAIELRGYAISIFNALDGDGDGVITRVDIEDFRDRFSASLYTIRIDGSFPPETLLFRMLDKNLSLIGHVVHSHIAVMPSPMGGAHSIDTYGISREDLETWPARVSTMLVDEFEIANAPSVSQ
jgi:hypothetical protein